MDIGDTAKEAIKPKEKMEEMPATMKESKEYI